MDQIKKAYIEIGEHDPHVIREKEYHIYCYPEDISEWELAEEILNLVEFYDELVYPIYWPPHIRKDKVISWVEGSHICASGTQCTVFCNCYKKGCVAYATK